MKARFLIGLGLAFIALVALTPVSASAGGRLFPVPSLTLAPPASAAPRGYWTMIPDYGYMWLASSAAMDAEWAPWDPWWAMPYGHWCLIPGYGVAWSGGLVGMDPSLWPSSNGYYEWRDKEVAQAWVNRHQHTEAAAVSKVKMSVVVASPPPTMLSSSRYNQEMAQANGYRPAVRPNGKPDTKAGRHKEKGHVRTWDEIIAARKARGLYGPPVHQSYSGDGGGGNTSGPSYSSGHNLKILPSASSGASKQK